MVKLTLPPVDQDGCCCEKARKRGFCVVCNALGWLFKHGGYSVRYLVPFEKEAAQRILEDYCVMAYD